MVTRSTLELVRRLVDNGSPLTGDRAAHDLAHFVELVLAGHSHTNLIGGSSLEERLEILLSDALELHTHMDRGIRTVLDVGAGAGAPTLPWALLRPELSVTLVEPRTKRIVFLQSAVQALGLHDRVTVHKATVSPSTPIPGTPFDLALSRATFKPDHWLSLAPHFAPRWVAFLTDPQRRILSRQPAWEHPYSLPFTHRPMWLTGWKRTPENNTP